MPGFHATLFAYSTGSDKCQGACYSTETAHFLKDVSSFSCIIYYFFARYMTTTASPSWSEFWNFIKFLSFQLQDCERSYYTNPEIVSDGSLKGFKEFIVKFMIQMSKVSVENTPGFPFSVT